MTFRGQLFPYQDEALDLVFQRDGRGLLAMGTGTGKTPTALAAIEELMEVGEITEPGFIVTLASTKYQWAKAIEKFTDSRAIVIDGTPQKRARLVEQGKAWREEGGADYFVVNYEQFRNDAELLRQLPSGFWVFDESQKLSNWTTKHYAVIESMLNAQVRIGLTGTPMTRGKPEQLFGQMRLIDPRVFGTNEWRFRRTYVVTNDLGWDSGYKNLDQLHRKVAKASITKLEDDPDVSPFLPKVIYTYPITVPLDRKAAKLYNEISGELSQLLDEMVDQLFSIQDDEYGQDSRGEIGQRVTALRMLVDHPELLRISASRYEDEDDVRGSEYAAQLVADGWLDGLKKSPKLEAMVAYVKDFLDLDPENKVVIFTAFVPMVDLIAEAFGKIGSVKLTGELSARKKEAAREAFNTDPDVRLFISSDAGGVGIDLPAGNLLVNYDRPWTSGQLQQRNGRIKRASSIWKHIKVQDFSVANSLEERLDEVLEEQRRVGDLVLRGSHHDTVEMTAASLRKFMQTHRV